MLSATKTSIALAADMNTQFNLLQVFKRQQMKNSINSVEDYFEANFISMLQFHKNNIYMSTGFTHPW